MLAASVVSLKSGRKDTFHLQPELSLGGGENAGQPVASLYGRSQERRKLQASLRRAQRASGELRSPATGLETGRYWQRRLGTLRSP